MKFFLALALLTLSRNDHAGRRRMMREALFYQRLAPNARMDYLPARSIQQHKRTRLGLAFVMVAIDNPRLIGQFLLVSFVFACLMFARLFIYLYQ